MVQEGGHGHDPDNAARVVTLVLRYEQAKSRDSAHDWEQPLEHLRSTAIS